MSRVDRTENPSERRGSEQLRQAEKGRSGGSTRREDPNPGRTPTKPEGEESDIEQALQNQEE